MKIELQMKLSKSTKGTHVYTNEIDTSAVQTIYVKRAALPEKPPATLTLTLEYQG